MFPFKFKGKTYNDCTYDKGKSNAWCSTKVDEFGEHVDGHWIKCKAMYDNTKKNTFCIGTT